MKFLIAILGSLLFNATLACQVCDQQQQVNQQQNDHVHVITGSTSRNQSPRDSTQTHHHNQKQTHDYSHITESSQITLGEPQDSYQTHLHNSKQTQEQNDHVHVITGSTLHIQYPSDSTETQSYEHTSKKSYGNSNDPHKAHTHTYNGQGRTDYKGDHDQDHTHTGVYIPNGQSNEDSTHIHVYPKQNQLRVDSSNPRDC